MWRLCFLRYRQASKKMCQNLFDCFLFWFPIFVQFVLDATRISFELAGPIKLIPIRIVTLITSWCHCWCFLHKPRFWFLGFLVEQMSFIEPELGLEREPRNWAETCHLALQSLGRGSALDVTSLCDPYWSQPHSCKLFFVRRLNFDAENSTKSSARNLSEVLFDTTRNSFELPGLRKLVSVRMFTWVFS